MKTRSVTKREAEQQAATREVQSERRDNGSVKVSTKSGHSSITARKKRLELEAAEAKVKLENEIARREANFIDMRLSAKIAALEEEQSRRSFRTHSVTTANTQNNWLERSNLNDGGPHLHDDGTKLPAEAPRAAPTDIQQLAYALKDAFKSAATEVKNNTLLSRISTNKDLPIFSGDPLEWFQFKQSYLESTEICKFSDVENIWRLRKCLRGEAKETVTSLLIGNTPPVTIIDALQLRFGRPDLIISKLVQQLKKTAALPSAYHASIVNFAVRVKNYVAAVKAIEQDDYLRCPELLTAVISKCPSTLICKWTDYFFLHSEEKKSKLEIFAEFLNLEASRTAAASVSHIISQAEVIKKRAERPDGQRSPYNMHPVNEVLNSTPSTSKSSMPSTSKSKVDTEKCKFCKENKHALASCPQFKRALRRSRWNFVRIHKLCFKCLESHHSKETCPAKECDVDGCNQAHHRLLHWPKKDNDEKKDDDSNEPSSDVIAHATVKSSPRMLLKVVPVTVLGPKGAVKTFALLDDGAAFSLMSADIAEAAGLKGDKSTMSAKSAWTSSKITCEIENITCTISNDLGDKFTLHARKMNELDLASQTITRSDIQKYQHLRNQDEVFTYYGDVKPKILIGHDHYHLMAPLHTISGPVNEPYATKTSLGWCIHGFVGTINGVNNDDRRLALLEPSLLPAEDENSILHVSSNHSEKNDILLHEEVKRSFALESIGVSNKPRDNADDLRAISILDNTAKLVNGRWEVGLPWKSNARLPDSYPNAYRRLRTVEKKMATNSYFALRYKERVDHLLLNDFARELEDESSDQARVWYLPHFGVDNPNKKKLRLVFDAAAASGGHSLNDYLLQGPDLLQSLLGIMMRFREEPVGIIGDIKDMFLRVKIIKEDQHALRFLWRDNRNEPIKKFVMTSLIFGANCSPFVAKYIKNKNALRFQNDMPEAVNAIFKSHYMDDYVDSQREEKAIKLIKDVTYIHAQGGFEIRGFLSNNPKVLEGLSGEALNDKAVNLTIESQSERTLGLLWYPASDTFGFDLSFKRIPNELLTLEKGPTKRELLRIVMSIFDVYGFLAPFTIRGKIILQATWKTNTHWDDKISDNLFASFKIWISQLMKLRDLRIPRWYLRTPESKLGLLDDEDKAYELHIFCDASPAAYAAVAYWRVISKRTHTDGSSSILTSFVASKCRVTPVKAVSIPRLELQAALLGSRLAETIQTAHRYSTAKRYFWTDSTTVLHWIRNDTRNYKTFVANRLGEIDSLTNIVEWHYIPTSLNPADKTTKISNYELSNDCEWFRGPDFLLQNIDYWPAEPIKAPELNDDILEVCTVYNIEKVELPVPNPIRFSSWLRLLRTTAAVLLFTKKCQKNPEFKTINCQLLETAEVLVLKHAQKQTFQKEIACLTQGKQIERNSRLRTLTPFISEDGLLRVDGRINAAQGVDVQVKNPVILDGRCHVARLIMKHYHERAAHAGNEMVVNELRQKYWIVNLRPTVRTVASQCLVCRKRKIVPSPARLGDLPDARLSHHQRPFTLKERAPREEVLLTLLAEIENMINSRPLTHVSVDPTSKEALTPNHFLLGSSSGLPIPGSFSDSDLCSRKQWRIAQRLAEMYWQRWLKEVLPTMLPRQRWNRDERPLREGDLVVVVDPSLPRNTWPMGIVEKTFPGSDGRVRVVDVKTKRGTFRRPVTRVALLPADE